MNLKTQFQSRSLIFPMAGALILFFAGGVQSKPARPASNSSEIERSARGETKMTEKAILAGGPARQEPNSLEKAVLAGGCFWGLEELFRQLPGVTDTEVGYTGGDVKNATYENHGTHAEAIRVTFDPAKTSYRALLEFFFQTHDPTTKNRQGNDIGMSYRSAIFYVNETQRKTAETLIKEIDASKKWPGPVVTQVAPASDFWSAEDYHQDYLQKNPGGYTCHYVRPKWKLK
jgi:peptide-methionine (S)-S-oxide reductase